MISRLWTTGLRAAKLYFSNQDGMSKRNITIFLHEHNVFAMDYKIYGC